MSDFVEIEEQDVYYNLVNLRQLVFEVTDACNLRCKYCGYADLYEGYDTRENLMLPFYKAKLLIDYLYKLWESNKNDNVTDPISIGFYGGEPLLNVPFIKQVIDYIESLEPVGKTFFYNMTTNAILLDRYMDFFVQKKFNMLISLDGDEAGQSYRVDPSGKNSFDRVFENVQLLRSTYPEYFDRHVNFNTVLHNRNSVESAFYFIKDNFGKATSIAPLNNSGIRKDKIDEFNKTYKNFSESVAQASDCETLSAVMFLSDPQTHTLATYIHHKSGNVFNNYNELLFEKDFSLMSPTGTCTPFSKKMFITVKGRILQCEKINHEFALGQILEDKVDLDLKRAANQYNGYVFKYAKQCLGCASKLFCPQCVFQIDDINEESTKCLGYCSSKKIKERDDACLMFLGKHPELYKRIMNEVVIRG